MNKFNITAPTKGLLYVAATPLGNLADVSNRLCDLLKSCDLVAAEDTRVAKRLLSALGITKKHVVSVRQHNERSAAAKLAVDFKDSIIVYLSDAGTPSICDPGAVLVEALRLANFSILPLPGPCASASAVSVAGFNCDQHIFAGFLPRQKKQASATLSEYRSLQVPIVLFEAPTRLIKTLKLISEVFGEDIEVCICAELTKMHESVSKNKVSDHLKEYSGEKTLRGEYTLVIAAVNDKKAMPKVEAQRIMALLLNDLSPRRAASLTAKITGANARDLYKQSSSKDD